MNAIKNHLFQLLILLLLNFIYFYRFIFSEDFLSSADILQQFPSFNIDGFYSPQNSLLFDTVTQFIPWNMYTVARFGSGVIPLWNLLNGGGVPLLANMQSAVFFPLTWINLLFDIQTSLYLIPLIKLLLIGIFTYIYFQKIGVNKPVSVVSATAFMFSGFNIGWILWPHSNAIIFLPLLFALIEHGIDRMFGKNVILLLITSYFLLFLSGHPESIFHVVALSWLYAALRSIKSQKVKENMIVASLSIFVGALLASFQLLPFGEYLLNSYAFAERSTVGSVHESLPLLGLIYFIFPNILGNPATNFYRPIDSSTNYIELFGGYCGTFFVLVGLFGIIRLFRSSDITKSITFLMMLCTLLIYDIPFVSFILNPVSEFIANQRLVFFLAFGLCTITAITLQEKIYIRFKHTFIYVIGLIIAGYTGGVLLLKNFPVQMISAIESTKLEEFINYEIWQMTEIASSLVLCFVVLYAASIKKNINILYLLIPLVFIQTAGINFSFLPSVEQKYFYPKNSFINELQRLPQGNIYDIENNTVIPPDINIVYELPVVGSYDAVENKDFFSLYTELLKDNSYTDALNYLNIFGIRYVVSYADIEKKIVHHGKEPSLISTPLKKSNTITSTFISSDNNLYGIRLLPANFNRNNSCTVTFSIKQVNDTGKRSKTIHCNDFFDKHYYQVNFEPFINSRDQRYMIMLESDNLTDRNAVAFWMDKDKEIIMMSVYDIYTNTSLNKIYANRTNIYENREYQPAYIITSSNPGLTNSSINQMIIPGSGAKLSLNTPEKKIFITYSPRAGYLLLNDSYYPGWKALVNGVESDIIEAQSTFPIIKIPKGKSTVEYYYDSTVWKLGIVISLVTLISTIGGYIYGDLFYMRMKNNKKQNKSNRKNFNLLRSFVGKGVSRINENIILILLITLIAAFLRLYELSYHFQFAGEIGDNLLVIKNAYLQKSLPLVGPPTSHSWLDFAPLYYWIYGPILILSRFNPVSHAYFGSILAIGIVVVNYIVVQEMFNRRAALISSLLIAVSPLFVDFARTARFFSLVALLVYPFVFFLSKVLAGEKKWLFWMFFFYSVMFSFHFTPLMLMPLILYVLWSIRKLLNVSDFMKAVAGFIIPILPLLIYDISHGFDMSKGLILWIPYRVAGFLGLYPKNTVSAAVVEENTSSIIGFFERSFIDNIHWVSGLVIATFVVISVIYLIIEYSRNQNLKNNLLIVIWFVVGLVAVFIHGKPPIHYFLPIFPVPIIILSLLLAKLTYRYKFLIYIFAGIFCCVLFINMKMHFSQTIFYKQEEKVLIKAHDVPYSIQQLTARTIIGDADGKRFTLRRVGPDDQFEYDYAQNYIYLLWWYGNEPVQNADTQYTIYEDSSRFERRRNEAIIYKDKGIIITRSTL